MELRTGSPEEAGLCAERIELVKTRCREWVDEGIHPALVVLVARHGVIALHEAYGSPGPNPDDPPLTKDAVFWLASLTKPVTATALMLLGEDGLVGLTRPVHEYIPEFVGAGKEQVCVHHLLTHTSGIKDEDLGPHMAAVGPSAPDPPDEPTQHPRVAKYLSLGYEFPLSLPPGKEMWYCNYGYELVGEIVRRVSGCSNADFVQSRIFGPLGMADTSYGIRDDNAHRVVGRAAEGLPAELVPFFFDREVQRTPWSMASLYSTAADMAVLVQIVLNGGTYGGVRILSRYAVREMTRNQIPGVPGTATVNGALAASEGSWGYGWTIAGNDKWTHYVTMPVGSFNHRGGGATFIWEIRSAICSA